MAQLTSLYESNHTTHIRLSVSVILIWSANLKSSRPVVAVVVGGQNTGSRYPSIYRGGGRKEAPHQLLLHAVHGARCFLLFFF